MSLTVSLKPRATKLRSKGPLTRSSHGTRTLPTKPGDPVCPGGANVAVKMPPGQFRQTVAFYRDILSVPVCHEAPDCVSFDLGTMRLRIDRSESVQRPETWLEIRCRDHESAARHLSRQEVPWCDEVEPLADRLPGFWIMAPGGRVHLIRGQD